MKKIKKMGTFASILTLLLVVATGNGASASQEFSVQNISVANHSASLNAQVETYKATIAKSAKNSSVSTGRLVIMPRGGFATSAVSSFIWSINGLNIKVPGGCWLNMKVSGKGLKLDGTFSAVECIGIAAIVPGMFCNWKGVYRFVGSNGKEYARQTTATRKGCGQASFHIPGASPRKMKTGKICLDFINNGTRRGTTCMAVFP